MDHLIHKHNPPEVRQKLTEIFLCLINKEKTKSEEIWDKEKNWFEQKSNLENRDQNSEGTTNIPTNNNSQRHHNKIPHSQTYGARTWRHNNRQPHYQQHNYQRHNGYGHSNNNNYSYHNGPNRYHNTQRHHLDVNQITHLVTNILNENKGFSNASHNHKYQNKNTFFFFF